MAREKVLVGMSGGVDSAAAAALLKEEGFEVTGCILRLLPGDEAWEQNLADAQAVADTLGIRLLWADYSDLFRRQVVDYFTAAYQAGLTPNPCVRCNASVKFTALCREADALGAPYIATGHYAQVDRAPGRAQLLRGEDRRKDQSYFLYPLPQSVLRRLLLPLGRLTKGAVRSLAAERGLVNAGKRDSQDICFIPGGDYGAFLAERGLVSRPGDFRDTGGRVLGRHQGLERYTTGQRRGLGVSGGRPLYVVGKDLAANAVILGDEADLYARTVWAETFHWVSLPPQSAPLPVTAKTRYSQSEAEAVLYPEAEDRVRVVFSAPQRAVTPGQSLVVYTGDAVAGGAVICRAR